MPTTKLLALWNEITRRLDAAFALLPAHAVEGAEGETIAGYRELIEHNELELALDELEALGDTHRVPERFWRELLIAAELMELDRHVQRLSSRLGA